LTLSILSLLDLDLTWVAAVVRAAQFVEIEKRMQQGTVCISHSSIEALNEQSGALIRVPYGCTMTLTSSCCRHESTTQFHTTTPAGAEFIDSPMKYNFDIVIHFVSLLVSHEGSWSAERLLKETLETVRKEEEERLRLEAEQAWLTAEKERLAEETESMQPMFKRRDEALSKIETVSLAKKEVSSLVAYCSLFSLFSRQIC